MVDLPVPPGTVLRVRSSGVPRLAITQSYPAGGFQLRTQEKPVLVRVPGPQGPTGPPGGVETVAFSGTGVEYIRTGNHRVVLETNYTVVSVRATVGNPPLGSPLIVDVRANGASLFASPSYRPTIQPTAYTGLGGAVTGPLLAGTVLTVNVVAVGAVARGSDLAVVIRLQPVNL